MTDLSELRRLDLEVVAERCAKETRKFYARGDSRTEYCLELFRRALVLRNEVAWDCIYRQYNMVIRNWVRTDQIFQATGESEEYFANRALERFWQAIQGEKFERFETLPSLMSYMRMCVKTSLIDYARARKLSTMNLEEVRPDVLQSDDSPEKEWSQKIERRQFWLIIQSQLKSKKERIIVNDSFLLDLKPGEIYTRYDGVFSDTNEIYKIKRNVLKRLGRSPSVRQFLAAS